ncbi:EFR1 family ferrodoxin [Desulfatibacillum aliphaticivorans]|uniref:EFR1 family ferrodoxin n=1 Tax=Desulfatibacillum aliphaticivorans TaxID=218208 RepID=UPI0004092FD8|nr:EFR1 family ferrodoxin [Desulfatibacillum aliphaticivorans]
MDIQSVKVAYFSPTGTSKTVAQAVAQGIGLNNVEQIDITQPGAREQPLKVASNDLLVAAVPVYAGRVPGLLMGWLQSIEADNSPCVCIAVYGNREFDDALLELKETLEKQGCKAVAGAGYIGEHSFSAEDTPIAVSRPDEDDLKHAQAFGAKIKEKLDSLASADRIPALEVPGNHPYKEMVGGISADFIEVSEACTQCGICEDLCPTNAIDYENDVMVDVDSCIRCCACIKGCPENARSMKASKVKEIAKWLADNCKEPKQPVNFL